MGKKILAALLFVAGALVYGPFVREAVANRNSSGVYSLPGGNPVTTGTTITSSWANTTLTDIGSELTLSLDRNGRSGMNASLPLHGGASASAPDLNWTVETNTGLYRAAAGDIRMAVGAVDAQKWSATTSTFPLGWNSSAANTTTIAGTTGGTANSDLQAGLAAGSTLNHVVGIANTANNAAAMSYTPNATAANSQACLGVVGNPGALCTDGNAKIYIGAGSTAVTKTIRATGSAGSGGSRAANTCAIFTLTATGAVADADCHVSMTNSSHPSIVNGSAVLEPIGCYVTLNTCNIIFCNNTSSSVTEGNGTYNCRIWNP